MTILPRYILSYIYNNLVINVSLLLCLPSARINHAPPHLAANVLEVLLTHMTSVFYATAKYLWMLNHEVDRGTLCPKGDKATVNQQLWEQASHWGTLRSRRKRKWGVRTVSPANDLPPACSPPTMTGDSCRRTYRFQLEGTWFGFLANPKFSSIETARCRSEWSEWGCCECTILWGVSAPSANQAAPGIEGGASVRGSSSVCPKPDGPRIYSKYERHVRPSEPNCGHFYRSQAQLSLISQYHTSLISILKSNPSQV